MLASKLDALNKRYERFQLVDRKRLGEILAERDMQLAVADNTQAVQAGKLADVQAIIYGTVHVVSKDEQASRSRFDFASKRNVTEYYTKRYCSATVTFTMDDVRTSKTLVTLSLMREYDSDKNKDPFLSSLGTGGNNVSPSHQVITDRIEQCVQEFIQKISPHSVEIVVKMEKGKSKAIGTGNRLARTGDYEESLEWYRRGLAEKPDDDGAMFNTGLVYEAQGNLKEAEQWYSKAFSLKDKEKYLQARTRVRQELVE
jgi:tetratricopeptide (TPR) repeat protein